ncbi:MAG: hypothetical protein A2Y16_06395 [Tenericutes bacterium GWF2_57_13]|nr:MAG: hypothetical protein A2Y16_06395 [Tenericutes bacterium GWF2_57_13]
MMLFTLQEFFEDWSVLELTPGEIAFNLLVAFALSLWVLFIYKLSYQTTVYNKSFSMTLPVSALITTMVIMAVSSNVVLSLGMVGALSIVRFRTAIKNPLDTIFMFWTIGIGITVGAGSGLLAVLGSAVVGLAIMLVQALEIFTTPYILIVRIEGPFDEDLLLAEAKRIYPRFVLRNKSVQKDKAEFTFEVRGQKDIGKKIDPIKTLPGVQSVMLLSYRGDYVV